MAGQIASPRSIIAVLVVLLFILWFQISHVPTSQVALTTVHWLKGQTASNGYGASEDASVVAPVKLGKISMFYGSGSDLYERAVATHENHARRQGYRMFVLRRQIQQGYWSKLRYMQSILVQELAKPAEERLQWLMWVDADSMIVNPALGVHIFLPPDDYSHIHVVGSKDQNGFNTGVFFLRVDEWSINMLAKSLAFPLAFPEIDLGTSADQVAMNYVCNETEFRQHVVYQPRQWFNTYEFNHGYEGEKGDLLVHFPGLAEVRFEHMANWLQVLEGEGAAAWELPYEQTNYPPKIDGFWAMLRQGRDLVLEVTQEPPTAEHPQFQLAVQRLKTVLEEETDRLQAVIDAMDAVRRTRPVRQEPPPPPL